MPNRFFWSGWIASFCFRSLAEDYYGQADMIRRMQEDWIDSSITVPFALIGCIIAYLLYKLKEDK
ncbi:MAG: hypothetical protein GWN86_08365 [Desulfobacterales bacterium]|nr:hypothetical protein [Desulfobacterales bacterium]